MNLMILSDIYLRANAPCRRPQSCSQHYGTLTIFSAVSASLSHLCQNHGMVSNPDTNNRRRQTGILCVYIYIYVYIVIAIMRASADNSPALNLNGWVGGALTWVLQKKVPTHVFFTHCKLCNLGPAALGSQEARDYHISSYHISNIIIHHLLYLWFMIHDHSAHLQTLRVCAAVCGACLLSSHLRNWGCCISIEWYTLRCVPYEQCRQM